jgi:hypothetical protein
MLLSLCYTDYGKLSSAQEAETHRRKLVDMPHALILATMNARRTCYWRHDMSDFINVQPVKAVNSA